MENRLYIKKLDSYQRASDLSKERMGTNPNYNLELLPTKQMQEEMWDFLQYTEEKPSWRKNFIRNEDFTIIYAKC